VSLDCPAPAEHDEVKKLHAKLSKAQQQAKADEEHIRLLQESVENLISQARRDRLAVFKLRQDFFAQYNLQAPANCQEWVQRTNEEVGRLNADNHAYKLKLRAHQEYIDDQLSAQMQHVAQLKWDYSQRGKRIEELEARLAQQRGGCAQADAGVFT
jgi:hypothetical protein